jgi:hypothetical protein
MKLSARRHALYSKLPPELADLCRSIRQVAEAREAGKHDSAELELECTFLIIERVRRWEDRQMRLQDSAMAQITATKAPRKQRKVAPGVPHLRLVQQ